MEIQLIQSKIHTLRGERVMLDFDLAELYDVETRRLKEAVRRNIERFPDEFMFELTPAEFKNLRSQIATSSWGGTRYPPFAFTEHGVAMLSGVLNSPKAIQTNIAIVKAFIAMRRYSLTYTELALKIAELEARMGKELADIREVLRWMGEENQARVGEIDALDTAQDALFDRIPEDPTARQGAANADRVQKRMRRGVGFQCSTMFFGLIFLCPSFIQKFSHYLKSMFLPFGVRIEKRLVGRDHHRPNAERHLPRALPGCWWARGGGQVGRPALKFTSFSSKPAQVYTPLPLMNR